MTTIHAYTGYQRLVDFPPQGPEKGKGRRHVYDSHHNGRCGRSRPSPAPNWPESSTGWPSGCPPPNVSLVDFVATVQKSGVTVSDVNEALKNASESQMPGILGYSEEPLVSVDYNGSSYSSVVDASVTYVVEDMVKVLSWYDNESGYSHRMVDLAAMMGARL